MSDATDSMACMDRTLLFPYRDSSNTQPRQVSNKCYTLFGCYYISPFAGAIVLYNTPAEEEATIPTLTDFLSSSGGTGVESEAKSDHEVCSNERFSFSLQWRHLSKQEERIEYIHKSLPVDCFIALPSRSHSRCAKGNPSQTRGVGTRPPTSNQNKTPSPRYIPISMGRPQHTRVRRQPPFNQQHHCSRTKAVVLPKFR